jgi:PIN domain nuclease of toxin-antitoxin system
MRALLDTQVWLWWLEDSPRLGRHARQVMADPANELYLSAASSWEIAIKCALGKLSLPETPEHFVPSRLIRDGILGLAIDHIHALRAGTLPRHHGDPFDRMLVAQAQVEKLSLISADEKFALYDVKVIPAG